MSRLSLGLPSTVHIGSNEMKFVAQKKAALIKNSNLSSLRKNDCIKIHVFNNIERSG